MGSKSSRSFFSKSRSSKTSTKASLTRTDSEIMPDLDGIPRPPNNALEFKYIGGRRFYDEKVSSYVLPTDIDEVDRIQQQHFALKHICHGNHIAPIDKLIRPGSKILDVGCGPGQWSLEVAQEFPEAQVYGIDINSNFPSEIKPINCEFVLGDVENPLPWEDNYFDYVFMRYMFGAIKVKSWPPLLQEINRVLKPGGIIENHEVDGIARNAGPKLLHIMHNVRNEMSERDLDISLATRLPDLIFESGFKNVHNTCVSVATGRWGNKIGEIWAANILELYQSMRPWLAAKAGYTDQEFDTVMDFICNKEIEKHQTYYNHHVVWAQK
ncbi:9005_t:CDS:2 [Ambispora leptoticha]|uniref:9005_t:CDS:1 n=1 Tax=Ambispora leptoticha TaxID=144679 RepID=A0A9N9BC25_9GLOM|nr:9005_t:CDS:2 [Ambispora leptoticha]